MPDEIEPPRWYRKHYTCTCGCQWEDEWDCLCNDRCPSCNLEIECDDYVEIEMSPEEIKRRVAF
jgi:hypothetical protein